MSVAVGGSSVFFAPLLAEAGALTHRLRQSVVLVRCGGGGDYGGHGSGVFWPATFSTNGDALVITNDHVVAAAADFRRAIRNGSGRIEIELADERRLPATVVARDGKNDLAALRVPAAPDLPPPVAVGDARNLRVGELIVAVGNPFGVRGTTTLGIVSGAPGSATWLSGEPEQSGGNNGRRRRRSSGPASEQRRDLLQADVVLAPGNSGGPLADACGRVVGIAAMILSPGIALAVPSHVVEAFVAALAAPGAPQRRAA